MLLLIYIDIITSPKILGEKNIMHNLLVLSIVTTTEHEHMHMNRDKVCVICVYAMYIFCSTTTILDYFTHFVITEQC